MRPIVQVSLDLTSLREALEMAETALAAGVDWLEVGTPLLMAEGTRAIRALTESHPGIPVVADLKIMDGGWLETELAAGAGATHVVVMGQAMEETVLRVVEAGREFGVCVMGDNLGMPDPISGARQLAEAGCDYVIHHIGYDYRTIRARDGEPFETPLDRLRDVVAACGVPVQAVGGLSHAEAVAAIDYGAPLVVIGAPLAIDASAFRQASGDVGRILEKICQQVHAHGGVR